MSDRFREMLLGIGCVLSFAYYIICIIYAHAGVSWLWIWPLLGLFCLARFLTLRKRIKFPKFLRIAYYTVLIAGVGIFTVTEGLIISSMNETPEPGLDYIITLGAAVRNGVPTSPLIYRIDTAAEYLRENPNTVVIASGGQGANEEKSEAETIRGELIARGIDESRILIEPNSLDTEQNINNSFALIPEGARVGVVSNSFHLCRAKLIAEYSGFELSGIPAPTLLPLGIHYTVREFFAIVKILLKSLW